MRLINGSCLRDREWMSSGIASCIGKRAKSKQMSQSPPKGRRPISTIRPLAIRVGGAVVGRNQLSHPLESML